MGSAAGTARANQPAAKNEMDGYFAVKKVDRVEREITATAVLFRYNTRRINGLVLYLGIVVLCLWCFGCAR